jgi:hypothetical protein
MKQALVILAIRGFVVGALFGGAMGYLASGRGETAPPAATTPAMTASPRAIPEAYVTPGSGPGAAASPAAIHREAVRPASTTPAPTSAGTDTSPRQSSLEIPGGKLGEQSFGDIAPLDKLLNSMSVYCTFDAGAGGQWPQGRILAHTAAWQGGPLEFDSINLAEHTAQLTRHPWTTTMSDSATTLWVTATDTGLHFSGIKPDGELLATTVFGALDSEGRHRSVLSLHGARLDHESAQFYGWCTVR